MKNFWLLVYEPSMRVLLDVLVLPVAGNPLRQVGGDDWGLAEVGPGGGALQTLVLARASAHL